MSRSASCSDLTLQSLVAATSSYIVTGPTPTERATTRRDAEPRLVLAERMTPLLGAVCRWPVAMGALQDFVGQGLSPRLGQALATEGDLLAVEVDLADFEVRR